MGRRGHRGRNHREARLETDQRLRRDRNNRGPGPRRERETGRRLPRWEGKGVQLPRRPGDEGDPGQGESGTGERDSEAEARRIAGGNLLLLRGSPGLFARQLDIPALVLVILGVDRADLFLFRVEQDGLVRDLDFVVRDVPLELQRHRFLHVELFFRFQLLAALLRPGDAPFRGRDGVLRFPQGARTGIVYVPFAGIRVEQRQVLAALLLGFVFFFDLLLALGFARLLLRGGQGDYGRVLAYQRPGLVQLLRVAAEALRRRDLGVIGLALGIDALVHALLRRRRRGCEEGQAKERRCLAMFGQRPHKAPCIPRSR